jgi:hypothetical protein
MSDMSNMQRKVSLINELAECSRFVLFVAYTYTHIVYMIVMYIENTREKSNI